MPSFVRDVPPPVRVNPTDEEIKEIFMKHDRNRDGQLTNAELDESLRELDNISPRCYIINYARSLGFTVQGLARN